MIKILIIDDEPIIREGLRKLSWKELGCQVIGEADDSEEGLKLLETLQPDIMLTDIKMPGMNGLELAAYVKKQYSDIEIIILTGYDDFSYAQTAVKIGVKDFLLKPTNFKELKSIIDRLAAEISEKRVKREELRRLKEQMNSALPHLKNKFIHDLLHGNSSVSVINERLSLFGIHIDKYVVFSVRIDNFKRFESENCSEECMLYEYNLVNICESSAGKDNKTVIIDQDKNMLIVVTPFADQDQDSLCMESSLRICNTIQKIVANELPFSVSIGVSEINRSFEQMNRAYLQSVVALNNKFFLGDSSLILYRDIAAKKDDHYLMPEYEKQLIYNNMRAGNIQEVKELFHSFRDTMNRYSYTNINYIKATLLEMVFSSIRVMGELNQGLNERIFDSIDPVERLYSCATMNELFDECNNVLIQITDMVKEMGCNQQKMVIGKITKFIETNFSEDISLDVVAEKFRLSTGYLSRLISKETGKTFMNILTDVRINNAKRLLLTEEFHKVSTIAEMVGYKDCSYFIQVFKRHTGLTPTEYKGMR
jgi:two-component system response regulator YesN